MASSRTDWFEEARFGLFVHWGHYAAAGWEASWPLVGGVMSLPLGQDVSAAEYHANAARFAPPAGRPREWAAAAKAAGMRYAIMGTRHHDGYSMWPTAWSDWKVGAFGPAPDIVGEFVAACREYGLRVGLYYSLPDWRHPDYPPFTDEMRPYVFGAYPMPSDEAWVRYLDYVHGQLEELLTRYGTIDILWFDGGWERPAEVWGVAAIEAKIRALQPDILINDRLPGRGDYATPEQFIPPKVRAEPWETCMTMNMSWGFNPADDRYKSATSLIHTLCEVVGRNGNLLLNIGPQGDGVIPPPQAERLGVIGDWMQRHGEAIHGAGPGLEPWQFYGPSTRKGDTVYCCLLSEPRAPVSVRGVPVLHLREVRALGTGAALSYEVRRQIMDELFKVDAPGEVLITVPREQLDPHATVLALTFEEGSLP